jgi:hypothetical protein
MISKMINGIEKRFVRLQNQLIFISRSVTIGWSKMFRSLSSLLSNHLQPEECESAIRSNHPCQNKAECRIDLNVMRVLMAWTKYGEKDLVNQIKLDRQSAGQLNEAH